jgi:hypothetical protein
MGGNKLMIKISFTVIILWVLLAFNWELFTNTVNEHQLVDKTKNLVYNMKEKVIKKDE